MILNTCFRKLVSYVIPYYGILYGFSYNPRFQVDYFSVRVWGGITVLPQHIWGERDPFTFKFYDREKGWPVGTGAYQLVAAGETEFIYRRRQD